MPDQSGISRLLIASAIDPCVYRKLIAEPEATFEEFALDEEERELLRHPDQRLLPLLGAALAQQGESPAPAPRASTVLLPPAATPQARSLPDLSLVLTLVPCAQHEHEQVRFAYAVWVSPLAEGVDPSSLGPPPGTVLPGQPLTPLHAVVQVSAVQVQDAAGNPQVGLTASLLQSSNIVTAPPAPSAGEVQAAVAAVRSASGEERYSRLIDLMHSLRREAAR